MAVGNFGPQHVSNFTGVVSMKGCVTGEADVRADKIKYIVNVEELDAGGGWIFAEGRVLISGSRYPVYEYGDCLLVMGKLERPGRIEDFSYDKYLARYDIYSVIYFAGIEKISESNSWFWRRLYRLKNFLEGRLQRLYSEPEAGFMAGILLGSRRGISGELMEHFNRTGLTHVLAISGYNITMVIVLVGSFFGFLSRRYRAVCAIVFVLLFVLLVGAGAAVVRAGIMGVIALLALYFGRQYDVGVALFCAAFLMAIWNPLIVVYDAGFQLSFLATFGVVYLSPRLLRYFSWVTSFCAVREALVLTLSAQIMTLPVILLDFGRISLIAPITNILVLPLIPFAMIFGFLSIFLGKFAAFFGYLILKLAILLVQFFSGFKFAMLQF